MHFQALKEIKFTFFHYLNILKSNAFGQTFKFIIYLFNKLSLSYNVKLNTKFPSTGCGGLRHF